MEKLVFSGIERPRRGEGSSGRGSGGGGGGSFGCATACGIPPRRLVLRMSRGILEMNLSDVRGECIDGVHNELRGRSR